MKGRRFFKLWFGICMVIILVGLSLMAACAKEAQTTAPATKSASSPTTSAPATTTLTPQSGGVLKIISASSAKNLGVPGSPSLTGDASLNKPAVESLFTLDSKGDPVPRLATGWQVSPDNKSITLTLRKGVKFHDGTDFNAEAAKTCLDMCVQGGISTELKPITSIDIVDDYTIKLNLSEYSPALINALISLQAMMVSPTALKTQGKDWCMLHPVGTGPFKFVSYQRDVSLKYEKFNGYWQQGKPYLDGIGYVFITDPVTALASLKGGEAHAGALQSPKDASDLKATGKYAINTNPSGVMGLVGDSARTGSIYADIRVRRAIAYAIDTAAIVKAIGFGIYPVATQFVAAQNAVYNPAVIGYPYNTQKAKDLLTEAGYPKGFQTTITFDGTAAIKGDVFTAIQNYLLAVNIDAKLDSADTARYTSYRKGEWTGLLEFGIAASIGFDPARSLTGYLASGATSYRSCAIPADYDALLKKAASELDPQKRVAQLQECQKMIIDTYCLAIPIYIGSSMLAYDSSKVGYLDLYKTNPQEWQPEDAWLKK